MVLYVARKPTCGCIVAACVDRPEWRKETATDIARWVMEGYEVARVAGPISLGPACPHEPRQIDLMPRNSSAGDTK